MSQCIMTIDNHMDEYASGMINTCIRNSSMTRIFEDPTRTNAHIKYIDTEWRFC